jgi:hypothetical protein
MLRLVPNSVHVTILAKFPYCTERDLRDYNNMPPEEAIAIFTNDDQESPKARHDIELANERGMKAHQAEEAERRQQAQAEYLQRVTP